MKGFATTFLSFSQKVYVGFYTVLITIASLNAFWRMLSDVYNICFLADYLSQRENCECSSMFTFEGVGG